MSLFAGVHIVHSNTLVAADVAAPVENAVTLLLSFLSPGIVTSAAAQEVTAVYAMRRQITAAIPSPKGAGFGIRVAEIGRSFVVNEITLCRGFKVVELGSQGLHPSTGLLMFLHHHLRGTVVLILHVITNDSEIRLRPPACLDLTATRQTMALTFQKHIVVEGLWMKRQNVYTIFYHTFCIKKLDEN